MDDWMIWVLGALGATLLICIGVVAYEMVMLWIDIGRM